MNNTKDDIKKTAEVAQFRFGIIAPVIQDLYPDASRTAYYKRVADSAFTLPDGSIVEYNYKTIEKWVSMYQRGGLEALMPHKVISEPPPASLNSEAAYIRLKVCKTVLRIYLTALLPRL
ncbi:hypothetical protein [Enterocloster citroniae]|uniref:Helix-turn-helix domain-containing protein n=2 Tax=Enterocloster citroniae TaxID=358743 RepID=A0ABV2G656_9FIRM|nr:hypothetical protein [Enterocloster citroniae]KMW09480.1 hypothetical protein HMPREF9470_05628 [[Clostridium] citroniae WAL-19142]